MRLAAALLTLGLVASWPSAPGAAGAAAPASSMPGGEIRVLTYNTHGLVAWVAGDDPATRFPRIAEEANRYDVALLQEDFSYHEPLAAGVEHAVVERGNQSRFRAAALCPVCGGSGLTLLARWPGALVALTNTAYASCHGWLGHANDCLATKGFQHARLRLPGGAAVDFVNTHLDAGRHASDRAARRAQLAALGEHLLREAAGRPLVVAGDFNLDAADAEDVVDRDAFAAALGLRDSGAMRAPDSAWQRLDYLYLRNSEDLALEVLDAREDLAFRHAGQPLSDHPALAVRLRVVPRPPSGD